MGADAGVEQKGTPSTAYDKETRTAGKLLALRACHTEEKQKQREVRKQ